MLHELFESFLLVFLAEMGDKSQLLAMTFAARYPIRKVLLGVLIGALLNDGLAVLLGSLVSTLLPIKTIQIVAGFTFIAFALWTLKPDGEEDESSEHKMKLGPVLTVAIAYFIGEFGDKTQLTAITLASQAVFPVMILAGTVSGMILTGGIGIWIGRKL
ncbi:MAG TPA: TMEM165/GDT1 family protein, partial [Clostridiales bacterium]|nr:TMEM165/GDT1 family protein [Clostridiales bacterium]